jgi:uncharacterized protein involved in exopolysaccharide biosynthesis
VDSTSLETQTLTLSEIASTLVHWRRAIFVGALVGAGLGAASGLIRYREYLSSATFVPVAANDQAASAGLALAASQFGVRLPTSGGGWPPATYVELLDSRGLLAPLALDSVPDPEHRGRNVSIMDLLGIEGSAPDERLERTIRKLRTVVAVSEVKKIGGVQVAATTRWPSVSLLLVQRLINSVNQFNTQTRQSQANAERKFVDTQASEAERALRDAEDRMQAFLQSNRVAVSPDLQFERDRLQRLITLRQQSYTSLLQARDEARIREVRDTPVITVIEPPSLPAISESRHAVAKAIMGAILGVLLATTFKALGAARRLPNEGERGFFQALDEALPRFLRRRQNA